MEANQFNIESPAFKNTADIPEDYTCHGRNISPPLRWNHVPKHAQELALICEDPDVPQNPPFIHWVVYHIPSKQTEFKENVAEKLNKDLAHGKNSAGNETYTGPNPPEDTGIHRYYFRLFSLDSSLDLKAGATADELMEAMRGHIIGETGVMGKHQYHH